MTNFQAFILGLVEGLTEFLPVSSTGHLILTKAIMGLGTEVDHYLVTIQLGATLAVALFYRIQVISLFQGLTGTNKSGRKLLINLLIAFCPAVVFGLALSNLIERHFFNPTTVAIALMLGGVIMIAAEKHLQKKGPRLDSLDDLNWKDALTIGFGQCAALWPGMSRSMSTIVTAQLRGCSNKLAADFSFLLALPTIGAATCYTLVKSILKEQSQTIPTGVSVTELPFWIGMLTSFTVGWLAVAGFLSILKKYGMSPFGYYRIVLGIVTLVYFWG
ncbi:MAG: undecaprenyl-diphosphate phosphatase [Sumerlaeia bacterium]